MKGVGEGTDVDESQGPFQQVEEKAPIEERSRDQVHNRFIFAGFWQAEILGLLQTGLAHAFNEFCHRAERIGNVLLNPRDGEIRMAFL